MSSDWLLRCCFVAASLPYFAIVAVLCHYVFNRAKWKRERRKGKQVVGFYPSAAGLAAAFLFLQVFVRPSLKQGAEVRQQEKAEEDDSGDPQDPGKQFDRELKRFRRGEKVDFVMRP